MWIKRSFFANCFQQTNLYWRQKPKIFTLILRCNQSPNLDETHHRTPQRHCKTLFVFAVYLSNNLIPVLCSYLIAHYNALTLIFIVILLLFLYIHLPSKCFKQHTFTIKHLWIDFSFEILRKMFQFSFHLIFSHFLFILF